MVLWYYITMVDGSILWHYGIMVLYMLCYFGAILWYYTMVLYGPMLWHYGIMVMSYYGTILYGTILWYYMFPYYGTIP